MRHKDNHSPGVHRYVERQGKEQIFEKSGIAENTEHDSVSHKRKIAECQGIFIYAALISFVRRAARKHL